MVNVSESDVAAASRILHDKSKRAKVLRWAALGIVVASFFYFAWMMTTYGEPDLPENLLIAALFSGFVALWLGFLAATVINIQAAWKLGAHGKAANAIDIGIQLVVCCCYFPAFRGLWWFTWFWFAMFAPFATPVLIGAVMLVTGLFAHSSHDGDEQLARAIHDDAHEDQDEKMLRNK